MRENFKEIPLLQQREIEAKVIAPLLRAFCREFGEERTLAVAAETLRELSRESGRETRKKFGSGLASLKENCIAKWNEGGALTSIMKEDNEDCCSFDVKECAFATLYKEIGCGDLGTVISCGRDAAFLEGFDETLELVRTKTIMEGGDCCDFCYRKKK